jgi:hypothetical protein
MPAGFIHPFWIESLEETASEIADARVVAVSLVATVKGLPAPNRRLRRLAIPLRWRIVTHRPRNGFGDQVEQRRTVHQGSITGCDYRTRKREGSRCA